ncbi:MAG TPA: acyl-CoA thioesterase [Acidobacteriota bacterium]|nr:acyl-CoA thioesterase [Acidobacteriota bacterium]
MADSKTVKNSSVEMIEIVFPNDANPLGNIFGGRVMQLMDIVGSISAMRHARNAVVTASMDTLNFKNPVYVGEILILHASVNFVATTSMEVGVKVVAENPLTGERRHTSSAYLTYVAIDPSGKPTPVPPIVPESDEEKRRYQEAQKRREFRLANRKK